MNITKLRAMWAANFSRERITRLARTARACRTHRESHYMLSRARSAERALRELADYLIESNIDT